MYYIKMYCQPHHSVPLDQVELLSVMKIINCYVDLIYLGSVFQNKKMLLFDYLK